MWSRRKSRLVPGVRRRTQGAPSCWEAGSRAGLGAGPGARLNAEGGFACHSRLAAVPPLLTSPPSWEGHAAQHRVRGPGWVVARAGREVPRARCAPRLGPVKLPRAPDPVRREDRVAGTRGDSACTGIQSCVGWGAAGLATPQGGSRGSVSPTPQCGPSLAFSLAR